VADPLYAPSGGYNKNLLLLCFIRYLQPRALARLVSQQRLRGTAAFVGISGLLLEPLLLCAAALQLVVQVWVWRYLFSTAFCNSHG
jgi:hypothetical protein